MEWFQ